MTFRFIIVDDDDYILTGTNDEVIAREWALNVLVYDSQTGKSLNADGNGNDLELPEAEPLDTLGSED